MKNKIIILLSVILLISVSYSQDTYYSIFNYSYFIPKVRINDHAVSFQKSLLPRLYKTRSVTRDMHWVAENDSDLVKFWQEKGDTVLHILREFSGIEWHESEFDIYLVRYYPSIGSSDPLVLPMGGINKGSVIESAPDGQRMILNLVYQLAKRMLSQAYQPEDSIMLSIHSSPLMRPSPFRFDNLAMLLALNTCQNIIGINSTYDTFESAFWKNNTPGREILKKYFISSWIISPDHTLADWIAEEPINSRLIAATRPPRKKTRNIKPEKRKFVDGLPLKGQLGISVKLNDINQLIVENIDIYRLAYACGLRTDDIIRRVNGRLVRNH
ncbi:MAG: hypothetical protein ACE5D6_04385, partial [Candidatus Zixiibacteriota bacterium]